MKTIGLIGGMSWESTIPYYSIINEYVKDTLGGFHSARIVLYSVDFAEIERCQSKGDWDKSAEILAEAASRLEKAGADIILICTNTMHKVYPKVRAALNVPMLHIAEATGEELAKRGIRKVALLGTRYTMQEDFYKFKLIEMGFEVIIPKDNDITLVNNVIFNELCLGQIKDDSRNEFSRIINELKNDGAEAVILGCTEIGLLVKQEDSVLPVFDMTVIHAEKAAEWALKC